MAEQQNVAVNKAINCVFFQSQDLCFNYKTKRFTRIPDFSDQGYFTKNTETGVIGQVVFGPNVGQVTVGFDLQDSTGGLPLSSTLTTQETDPNQNGKARQSAVRPFINGGTVAVRAGVRDNLSTTVTFHTGTAAHTLTGLHEFDMDRNGPEGRYHRLEFVITDGFTTALGADVVFFATGKN